MVSLYFPGDIVGIPQLITPNQSEVVYAMSDVVTARVDSAKFDGVFRDPANGTMLIEMMYREREVLANRLAAATQGDAVGKVAQFLVELISRSAVAPANNKIILQTPLRQSDIADFVGMTSVHVNRTLRGGQLRALVEMRGGTFYVKNVAELSRLVGRR